MPKVSVVIPTCNRPRLIKRTIDSVLKQTFQDFEIIIIDDGMKERAEEIVKNINDNRIRYIQHETNKGGGAARNTGIKAASGENIAFLDDDDEWLPEKLEKQARVLDYCGDNVGFCFTAVNNIYDKKIERSNVPEGIGNYHELALKSFKKFLTVTLLMKKEVFDIVGLFDEKLPSHQEAELMIRVTEKFKGIGINEPLVNVSMKSNHEQIGKNAFKRIEGEKLTLEKHLQKYQNKKKYLAKHYFQIGLWYRDSNDYANTQKYLLRAWKSDVMNIRYFLHFLINALKHNEKNMGKVKAFIRLIVEGKIDLAIYKFKKYIGLKKLLPPMPNWIIVEPTNICNCKCPACPTGSGKMNRAPRMMTLDEFKNIIDQIKGYTDKIVLFNYGEPLLNKNIIQMIEYAAKAKISVKLSTNGAFLKGEEFILRLVKSGLKRLIVCLDGIDQKTVSKYRIGVNFDTVIDGLKMLHKVKKENMLQFPIVELQFILMKHNEEQREAMQKLAKELEVDVYTEKTVGIDWRDSDSKKLAEDLLPSDVSLSRYNYDVSGGNIELKGKLENYCDVAFNSLTINSDGDVVPCCIDSYSEFIMGNVFKEKIRDIWKNKKYQFLRKLIATNRKSIPMCNICSESMYDGKVKKYNV